MLRKRRIFGKRRRTAVSSSIRTFFRAKSKDTGLSALIHSHVSMLLESPLKKKIAKRREITS